MVDPAPTSRFHALFPDGARRSSHGDAPPRRTARSCAASVADRQPARHGPADRRLGGTVGGAAARTSTDHMVPWPRATAGRRGGATVEGVALSLAISPCPNDTFVFHALVHGRVPGAPPVEVTYADVDVTNTAAERGAFDLVKVSYAALPWLLDDYHLLPCGGALGRGCGPLVLTRGDRDGGPDRTDLTGATVAVPGDRTTAYLLFRLWSAGRPPARIEVVPFHEIMPGVAAGALRRRAGHPRGPVHLPPARPERPGRPRRVVGGRHRPADPARRDPGPARRGRPGGRGRLDPRVGPAGLGRPGGQPGLRAGARPGDGARRGGPAHRPLRQRVHRGPGRGRFRRGRRHCSTGPPTAGAGASDLQLAATAWTS